MNSIRIRTCIALVAVAVAPLTAFADAGEDFHALLDEAWEFRMSEFPTFASVLGDRRYNDRWTDSSLAAIEARHNRNREFLRRLYAIDRDALSESDQLNYELYRRDLQNDVDAFQFNGHLLPFSHRGGVQTLNQLGARIRLANVQDYEDWLARMGKVDEVVAQTIALAEEGRKEGYMAPKILMERVPDQIAAQLVEDGTESPFYQEFAQMPDAISPDEQERRSTRSRTRSCPRIAGWHATSKRPTCPAAGTRWGCRHCRTAKPGTKSAPARTRPPA